MGESISEISEISEKSESTLHTTSAGRVLGRSLGTAIRSVSRCRVCGFSEIRTDEAVDRSAMLLAECPRCEHRWTAPVIAPHVVRPRAIRVGEVASAA